MPAITGSGALLLVLAAAIARADDKPDLRIVSTSGEAVVYVVPDEVIVNFGVETAQPELDKARAISEKAGTQLVKAIKELGIEPKHIQTDNLDISIRYKDGNSLVIEGYVARRGYAVTLKDTKKFERLMETALKNGANRLLGFEFRSSELRKHRDQARLMAVHAAREKAAALSEALDCQLGHARTIQEGGGYNAYWGSHWGGGLGNFMQNAQNVAQAAPGGGEGGEAAPLGQIGIRAQVSVTFDLVPFGK